MHTPRPTTARTGALHPSSGAAWRRGPCGSMAPVTRCGVNAAEGVPADVPSRSHR